MATKVSQLPQDEWLKDFQRIYVDGIDSRLISTIVRSLKWAEEDNVACSVARMMAICKDKGKWVYTPKESGQLKKTKYWRLRRVADFLGLPPWLLLLPDFNALLDSMFELKRTKFDVYPLEDFKQAVVDASRYLDFMPLSPYQREELHTRIDALLSEFYTMNVLNRHVEFPDSFFELYGMASRVRGEYSFSVEIPLPLDHRSKKNAHVRLVQGVFPEYRSETVLTKNHMWRSGWMSVVLEEDQKNYEDAIDNIVRTVSQAFEVNPLKFTKVADSKRHIVYSWHSLRFKLLSAETREEVEGKMSKVPLTMNHLMNPPNTDHTQLIYANSEMTSAGEFIHLLKWLSFDAPKECRPLAQDIEARFQKYKRRKNSLDLLWQVGYLDDGTVLEFDRYTSGIHDQLTCVVKIIDGKPTVMWRAKSYSITGLTRQILQSLGSENTVDHLNGNMYWKKRGDNKNLFQKANELVATAQLTDV